jgi:hypothetical protein
MGALRSSAGGAPAGRTRVARRRKTRRSAATADKRKPAALGAIPHAPTPSSRSW